MEVPRSTEALTKLLRSKEISTSQIYDIVSQFDHLDLYFPNKEIFVLELLIDRWNDQKLVEFKKDYKMWALFNDMWVTLRDDVILKKLFKRLKFVPHLIRTLESVDTDLPEFLGALKRTCSLVNSIITVDVSTENANSILGKTLNLVLKLAQVQDDSTLRSEILKEIETLAGLRNIPEVSTKSSNSYCDEVMLPSLKYISKFKDDAYNPVIEFLTSLLQLFVFSHSVDTIKLLERFASSHGRDLDVTDTSVLFEKSISFLSKEKFVELEKIFTIMVKLQPELSPTLLKELSLSKKTMSQEFLERLFDEALHAIKDQPDHFDLWQLIFYILELDIEIGIKNDDRLLNLISDQKDLHTEWTVKLWAILIDCHIDARELPQFLVKLESYCRKNTKSAQFLLTEDKFTNAISSRSNSFSISQYTQAVVRLLEVLEMDNEDLISVLVLRILLQGLTKLPWASLKDVKEPLKRAFKLKGGDQSQFWQIRYLIMEVFDDILPDEILGTHENQIETKILNADSPMDLLYYFFKLREFKVFDLAPVIEIFMGQFKKSTAEQQSIILANMLNNWSTIINSLFPHEEIRSLVSSLFSSSNIHILEDLYKEDDIFEEHNIMRFIVLKLINSYEETNISRLILKTPIQCINKTLRIELINTISKKTSLTELDMQVMVHLLENPTFKSDVESSWKCLEELMKRQTAAYTYAQPVFETIWGNHLSQNKEAVSKTFLHEGITNISEWLQNEELDTAYLTMAFLVIKSGGNSQIETVKDGYCRRVMALIEGEHSVVKNVKMFSWLLRTLYYVIDSDDIKSSQVSAALSNFIKSLGAAPKETDRDLLASTFLLYSALYEDRLEYIFAHYIVLREAGVQAALIRPGIEAVVRRSLECGVEDFNHALHVTAESFNICTPSYAESVLELYQIQIKLLSKENSVGCRLFVRSLSNLYTNISRFGSVERSMLQTLECINGLLTSKAWIFSQYCIEMLFPMCLKLNLTFIKSAEGGNDIFLSTTKLISSVLYNHRVKLSNRHHLVIAFISECLELLSNHENTKLSAASARSLSRLIVNFCEPIGAPTKQLNGNNSLNSKVGSLKNSLRKHIPILLIKYVHLSITSPFQPKSRFELATAMYSIFDLLSPDELGLVNAALDNAGRQYLRGLYADYRKTGKWHAD